MTELTAGGPAEKAGAHKGDVLVGLNDVEVRDRQAFVPLLATHKPGETITVNLRRGTEYLSLPVTLGTRPPLPPDAAERLAAMLGTTTQPSATRPATTQPSTAPTTAPSALRTPAPTSRPATDR